MLVAEVAPFSHVGGMARGTYALAKALTARGHGVRIATPFHKSVSDYTKANRKRYAGCVHLRAPGGVSGLGTAVCAKVLPRDLQNEYMYFIDNPDYFGLRSQIYGYMDDDKRYYAFSCACAELLLVLQRAQEWLPDIIQCHDWHTGYFVELLKKKKRYARLRHIPIVFTVHNFKYQNEIKFQYMNKVDLGGEPLADINSPELHKQNPLSRGMLFADAVNTVSPTHAKEVCSDAYEFSYNLSPVIKRIEPLSGILNGLDYHDFNPQTDKHIRFRYSVADAVKNRSKNKTVLRTLFSLPDNGGAPLFCYVGRLSSQKGLEFLITAMRRLLREHPSFQFIGAGDGEDYYCEQFWRLKKEFPTQVGINLIHDVYIPRKIFAGSDMIIIPSNYEPGGIVAFEAMRYGCVPVIRRTGGLNDIVSDYSPATGQGNGFSYQRRDDKALYRTMTRAVGVYRMRSVWQRLTENCMRFRNTWETAAAEYDELFRNVINNYGKRA